MQPIQPLDADSLRQQLLAHLRHIRNLGIDWIPASVSSESVVRDYELGAGLALANSQTPTVARESDVRSGGLSSEARRTALATLAAEVRACTQCVELCSTRTQTVFGDGEPGVELCFLGEAPGADEDRQGIPFVGEAGQLLNKIIGACGFRREEVYICNILKCRPPGNRTPLPDEAAHCRPFLEKQLELVAPKYIVALGACAAQNLLSTTLSVGKLRGRLHEYNGIPVLVTYHPAYLLPGRSPHKKRDVWEDMKMLLNAMGRPIPQT